MRVRRPIERQCGSRSRSAEFNNPNIQLLVKDDAGTAQGAQQAANGARGRRQIIVGRVRHSVSQVARWRGRGVPVIRVLDGLKCGGRGVYLFGFLPEACRPHRRFTPSSRAKRSFVALVARQCLWVR